MQKSANQPQLVESQRFLFVMSETTRVVPLKYAFFKKNTFVSVFFSFFLSKYRTQNYHRVYYTHCISIFSSYQMRQCESVFFSSVNGSIVIVSFCMCYDVVFRFLTSSLFDCAHTRTHTQFAHETGDKMWTSSRYYDSSGLYTDVYYHLH